jgi:hypothetical protein
MHNKHHIKQFSDHMNLSAHACDLKSFQVHLSFDFEQVLVAGGV